MRRCRLSQNGDSITLTFRTRLSAVDDHPDNRLFWGMGDTRPELHSIAYKPELADNGWRRLYHRSALIGRGVDLSVDFGIVGEFVQQSDILGRYRRTIKPTIGAAEYLHEDVQYDGVGRVRTVTLAGEHTFTYTYASTGHLTGFSGPGGAASYNYDVWGRRTTMMVGNTRYRTVYEGDDVVAEIIDEGDNGTIDRRRIYWLAGSIDRLHRW